MVITVKILCITLSCKIMNTNILYYNCAYVHNKLINVACLVNTESLSYVDNHMFVQLWLSPGLLDHNCSECQGASLLANLLPHSV